MKNEEAIEFIKIDISRLWNTPQNLEHKEALEMAIKALEQEPCDEYYSRQAIEEVIANTIVNGESLGYFVASEILSDLQPVTPQSKIGRWVKIETSTGSCYTCSECDCVAPCTEVSDSFIWKLSAYCPDCGARMKNALKHCVVEVKNDF